MRFSKLFIHPTKIRNHMEHNSLDDCIFCKIVKGIIPSNKIYEDNKTIAFLDISPVTEGHTLIIPKNHCVNVSDASNKDLESINKTCKIIGNLLMKKLNASGFNIVNASGKDAQQSVFHLHYHVIPRKKDDGLDLWFHGKNKVLDIKEIHKKLK